MDALWRRPVHECPMAAGEVPIGWMLRETSKRRPDLVYEWLCPCARRASGVMVREAVKHLPEDQHAEILDLRS